jgi:DNA-binding NtrC family response regulator
VRELENTVYQAVLLASDRLIHVEDLAVYHRPHHAAGAGAPTAGIAAPPAPSAPLSEDLYLEELERQAIVKTLDQCGWVQSRAAARLGVSRRVLNYKVAKFGLTHPSWRVHRGTD